MQELTSVSGIGESRALAIIDYREKNGRFGSIEDIKNVDGIKTVDTGQRHCAAEIDIHLLR